MSFLHHRSDILGVLFIVTLFDKGEKIQINKLRRSFLVITPSVYYTHLHVFFMLELKVFRLHNIWLMSDG